MAHSELHGGGVESSSASPQAPPSFFARAYDNKTLRVLAAGGLAGCVSKTVTAPLARLTILYQARLSHVWE